MPIISLHSKAAIEPVLRRDAYLNLYAIGDLDDFFWPYTTWYGLQQDDRIEQLIMLYTGTAVPTLLALDTSSSRLREALLRPVLQVLPRTFYGHITESFAPILAEAYQMQSHGLHYKMALTRPERLRDVDTGAVVQLSLDDCADLEELYRLSYPGNWFDPRMLSTGQYYGIREHGQLISVAGIHVYSPRYRVAALGNITTHPQHRKRGLARAVTAGLCRALAQEIDTIGLNVKADNASAIACYERLGFQRVAEYEEGAFQARAAADY